MDPESSSARRSLCLLTMFMVSEVNIVTGDSFFWKDNFWSMVIVMGLVNLHLKGLKCSEIRSIPSRGEGVNGGVVIDEPDKARCRSACTIVMIT